MLRIWTEGRDEFISDSYAAIINHLKDEIERLGGIIKLGEEVKAIEVVDGTSSPFTSLHSIGLTTLTTRLACEDHFAKYVVAAQWATPGSRLAGSMYACHSPSRRVKA